MKKCNVCGENLSDKYNYCPNCGEKVNKKFNNNISNKSETTKSVPLKYILIATVILLVLGFAILYLSGVFDTHKVETKINEQSTREPQGADLSKLEEINNLESQFKSNPNDYNTLLNLAHLLNDSGFKDKAIEKYQQYLKKFPKDADVLVDMGVCYYELGKNQNAIIYMKEALKYNPNHQIANLNLGIVHLSMEEIEKAKEYWKKALAINPNNEIGKKAQELINSH